MIFTTDLHHVRCRCKYSFSSARVTRGWVGGRVGREEAKVPQVKTQGPELLTDGPDHTSRPKGHHSGMVKARIPV